ncbi:bifunctional polynucleotide phosphatase/kinase-like [Lytechinus variegatus]|uniref:bifunctional polynucleotide phosphatase/kinase-like n=1 Tax=Lytechinus variegatus TaxID=7654 RepID=UPI001BB1EE02|nr:bifunctional polynucleotide phosphatase/kinase-like [Lytechinus variegatus]
MQCQLKPTRKNAAEFRAPHNIDVPRDQPTILGRSPVTGITEKKLSRQHVEVTANYSSQTLTVKQLGPNAACYQGEELQKGATVKLSNGDCFELLKGKFEYSVHFSNTETSTPSTSTSSGSLSRPEPKAKGNEEDGFDQEREQVKSSKKRPLDSDSDDGDSEQDEKPEVKKSKTETKPPGDDIDQKLAALQRKAELAEQKRKDKKLNSTPQIDGGGEKSSSGNADISGRGSTTAPAAGSGKPSTVEEWKEEGKLLVYKSVGVKAGSKIVCFDMDGTLITTSSGKVFAQNADDWKIIYSEVPGKLKKLHDGGYKIVIFTNQLGISKGKLTVKEFRRKLGNVVKKLGVPVQAFAATSGGVYRKPMTGMWEYLLSKGNDGIAIDVKASMYIGDAAGRPADWGPKKKKDFSMSDRLFALNIGIPFKTPEEFFLGFKPAKFNMPAFDPRTVSTSTPLFNPPSTALPASVQEVLILVGYPASGKSTFVKNHLLPHKYVHVNRDTIGTWQKCVAACSSALGKGQSVVIDNTNADIESRKRYIDCAKKANVQCRCFSFTTTIDHARHNEKFRQLTPSGKNHASIADMIFYSFRKNFVAPKKEEGYSEVVQVNFLPSFNNSDEEKLYKKFLLEK